MADARGFVTPGYRHALITRRAFGPSCTITHISCVQTSRDFIDEGCMTAIVSGAIPSSVRRGEWSTLRTRAGESR